MPLEAEFFSLAPRTDPELAVGPAASRLIGAGDFCMTLRFISAVKRARI
jgi:hypothetical protein